MKSCSPNKNLSLRGHPPRLQDFLTIELIYKRCELSRPRPAPSPGHRALGVRGAVRHLARGGTALVGRLLGFRGDIRGPGRAVTCAVRRADAHNLVLRSGPVAALGTLASRVRRLRTSRGRGVLRGARLPDRAGAPGRHARRRRAGARGGPAGVTVSFFASREHAQRLQQRYDLRRGAEVARLDHFNICVPDVPLAYSHYSSLGSGCRRPSRTGRRCTRRDVPQADGP